MTPPVFALFGPTAVGKTAVALALAELLRRRGEQPVAISADALQVYRGLETLTGAADAGERAQLEHRLISFVPVTERFSVGEFMPLAHAEIDAALESGRRPIVVGGTGLYLRAALCDLDLMPPPPPELRERLEAKLRGRGTRALHAELESRAPEVAATVEPTDSTRVVRALELLEVGALDQGVRGRSSGESQLFASATRHPTVLAGLVMEREALYQRIDARVQAIVAAGGPEEVRRADAAGASRTARKALGFQELLAGDVDAMKRRTRNYAKRQLSWMRRMEGVGQIDVTGRDPHDVSREIDGLAVAAH